jgi:hypothetical protein
MATNHGHDADDLGNPSVGFDKSDLNAKGILIFFLVLAIAAVAVHLGVLGMWIGMSRIAEKHDTELSPLAPKTVTPRAEIMQNTANINIQKFPEPRLQDDDTGDMARFLVRETEALTAQPWQDPQGNVHLPIDQAIKVVATRLPVRAGGAALPNYPGAGMESESQSAPVNGAAMQDENSHSEAENVPAAK